MSRSLGDRCDDILAAIGDLRRFAALRDTADPAMLERAIRDCFLVIGEAANSFPADIRDRHPTIPWDNIVGMRVIAAHHYHRWSSDIALETVDQDLPALESAITDIRAEVDND